MTTFLGKWTLALDGGEPPAEELIGGKARSIARLSAGCLPVPRAFVITTDAWRAYRQEGRLPADLPEELAAGVAWLERQTGRRFGFAPRPLLVSVRSGAAVSMPGMMDTVLNLGISDLTEAALALEYGDAAFARDTHRRFLRNYAQVVLKTAAPELRVEDTPALWRQAIQSGGVRPPSDLHLQLLEAVRAVFDSWDSPRARRYREHHRIDHALGTAVTVQAMVFGNLRDRSGSGVLFSRNPLTGEPGLYGEYLAAAQGEDVVSGCVTPTPLSSICAAAPAALEQLLQAACSLERIQGEVQDIEFTLERGQLYLLQARTARLAPAASARTSVDLVTEGLIDEITALGRLTAEGMQQLLAPRLAEHAARQAERIAQGEGACPGVGIGTVVSNADEAERRIACGQAVVLARPATSTEDLHAMIGATAVITEEGGKTSHAAVVSRALGIPCVVGCGRHALKALNRRRVTVDGSSGSVFAGALAVCIPDERSEPRLLLLEKWAQARAALKVLRPAQAPSEGVADLGKLPGGTDPVLVGRVITGLRNTPGIVGIRGGAAASESGLRAALQAGLQFVVTEAVLPTLLTALSVQRELSE